MHWERAHSIALPDLEEREKKISLQESRQVGIRPRGTCRLRLYHTVSVKGSAHRQVFSPSR